eukprot:GHVT01078282.1.p1 GENE.GHVT01078282.1~~GHVT01078282.1.p1  ORF type:complete len:196 (-),score=4.69 GHVT01078282.1:118-705(-)
MQLTLCENRQGNDKAICPSTGADIVGSATYHIPTVTDTKVKDLQIDTDSANSLNVNVSQCDRLRQRVSLKQQCPILSHAQPHKKWRGIATFLSKGEPKRPEPSENVVETHVACPTRLGESSATQSTPASWTYNAASVIVGAKDNDIQLGAPSANRRRIDENIYGNGLRPLKPKPKLQPFKPSKAPGMDIRSFLKK